MSHTTGNYGIHCNQCSYEGPGKTNSTKAFVIFMIILAGSAYFLPLIIAALAYMGWLIAQPSKYKCPKCDTEDVSYLTEEQAIALVISKAENKEVVANDESAK